MIRAIRPLGRLRLRVVANYHHLVTEPATLPTLVYTVAVPVLLAHYEDPWRGRLTCKIGCYGQALDPLLPPYAAVLILVLEKECKTTACPISLDPDQVPTNVVKRMFNTWKRKFFLSATSLKQSRLSSP